jgi:hypothetical protein
MEHLHLRTAGGKSQGRRREYRQETARRQQAHSHFRLRERQANGRAVLHVEVNLWDLTELLVAANLLQQWDDTDRSKIEQATARLLEVLAQDETRFEICNPDGA